MKLEGFHFNYEAEDIHVGSHNLSKDAASKKIIKHLANKKRRDNAKKEIFAQLNQIGREK